MARPAPNHHFEFLCQGFMRGKSEKKSTQEISFLGHLDTGTRNGGVEPADQGGRMKLTGRASCLLTHRSWIPVQQEASYQQKSCCPADLF
ncbi:hypothetical protein R6Z07F_010808 [Ovis aries]